MRTRTTRLLAGLAALSLVAVACGDDDDGGASPTTTAAPATATDGDTAPTAGDADDDDAGDADDAGAGDSNDDDAGDSNDDDADAGGGDADSIDRSDWPDSLTFAAVPAEQDAQLVESYRVTKEILEDELDLPIDFFQAADYAGVVEALIAGRVDMAQFGPFSYVIARANGAEAQPVGVMVGGPDEEPGYQAYLVAASDNDEINSLDDIVGTRVCFVDPASTSGYLVPAAGMLNAGIDPNNDVTAIFAGGHDASVIAAVAGDCDAAFAFDDMVNELLIDRGDIEEGDVKIVWESDIIAGSPLAARTTLPESLYSEIERIITESVNVDWAIDNGYCASSDDCRLSDEAIWGYVARDDSFYDGIRLICQELGPENAPQCEGI